MANPAKINSEKKLVEAYLAEHELERTVNEVLNECLRQRPEDPFAQIAGLFKEKSKAGQGVLEVLGRRVFDCNGAPAYEVELVTDAGRFRAQVSDVKIPTAGVRLDRDYFTSAVCGPIAKALVGWDPADLEAADQALLALDPTENKAKVGCNTLYATSVAMCKAGAIEEPVYKRIASLMKRSEYAMPVPWFTAIERAYDAIGIMPTGASSFSSAVSLAQEAIAVLSSLPEAKDPETSFADLLQAVAVCITERSWSEKLKLAVTVRELVLDDPPTASDEASGTAPGEAKEEETDGDAPQEGKEGEEDAGEEGAEEAQAVAVDEFGDASFRPPESARSAVLEAIKDFMGNEELGLLLAVAENVFSPWRSADMAGFVEEYGEQVLLLNHVSEGGQGEPDAQDKGDDAEAKEDGAEEAKSGGEEAEQEDGEDEEASADKEEGKTSSGSGDSGLPPCNGDRIYVGTPFSDVFTVTDLVQVCEANLSMGQSMVVVWEPSHATCDEFPADFCVGAGIGLVQFGKLASPNSASRLNQLLRIEEDLGSSAFFAGSRFRSPF